MSFTLATADFELGTNGATIHAADPGSLTAWGQVDIGGGGSVAAYSTTYAAHGALGARLKNATSGVTALHWGLGSGTEQWGRCYLKPVAWPNGTTNLLRFFNSGSEIFVVTWDSSGLLAAAGSSFANPVPLNQWARVEWHLLHSTTVGIIDLRLFQNADSIIPTEVKQVTGQNTGAACDGLVIGNSGSPGATYETGLDQTVAGAPALPGPFPVSTIAPTVAGSAAGGSTLFCDGGTWNGGAQFTLGYQWTRNGVDIASATSATYVTVDADASASVGCTVTATGIVATNESATAASSNAVTPTPPSPAGGGLVCRTLTR